MTEPCDQFNSGLPMSFPDDEFEDQSGVLSVRAACRKRLHRIPLLLGPRWSPRGGDPPTPSGPEGSSGNGYAGRRGAAGAVPFL
jgi:hypothetical protein